MTHQKNRMKRLRRTLLVNKERRQDMLLAADVTTRKKKLLEESYALIERLKKLRAINGNSRLVGINPRLERALSNHR